MKVAMFSVRQHKFWLLLLPALVMAIALLLFLPQELYAETYVVTSTGDEADANPGDGNCATSGNACTLRAALEESNASLAEDDLIVFSLNGASVQHIRPLSALPVITDTVRIDGITQPQASCASIVSPPLLKIELNGEAAGQVDGLVFAGQSSGSVVRGLVIHTFGGNGIVFSSDTNQLICSFVGTDATGQSARPNGADGVLINNAVGNMIGGTTIEDRNVIAGNGGNGINILTGEAEEEGVVTVDAPGGTIPRSPEEETPVRAAMSNQIFGNYIGTNVFGTVALPNQLHGVQIIGSGEDATGATVYSSENVVGTEGGRNLIAGNLGSGVALLEAAMTNTVSSNYIGVSIRGLGPLPNIVNGVLIENSAANIIELNLIAGNSAGGVHIADPPSSITSERNLVRGNIIGLDAHSEQAIPNLATGITIQNASHNTIGGSAESDRNVIAGNNGDGILVQRSPNFNATGNRIEGNYIGVNGTATVAIGNGGSGVRLFGAEMTTVHGNVIGGNGAGISLAFNETEGNILTGNYVGTDPTQTYPFGNGEHGIFLNSLAHDTQIGGIAPGEGNVIAFHSGRGIWMTAVGTNGNAIRGNSIHDNQGDEIENKLGIDLAGSGPNPNDLGDIDDGANKLQNYAELIGAYSFDGATVLNGHFNGAANTAIAIDIFYNSACDASGYGEGEFYQETIALQTDAFGNVGFSHVMATATTDQFVTTTATDPDGNTSEFSNCVAVTPALVVNSSDDGNDGRCDLTHCSLREALHAANAMNDQTNIVFGIPGPGPHTITPQSPLPMASYPLTIDGLSQPGAQCSGESYRPAPLTPLDHRTDLIDLIGSFDAVLKKEPPDKEEPPVPITPTLRIELAGTAISVAETDGLIIHGGNSVVRGLAINRFSGNGLHVMMNDHNVIACNLIGLDPEGLIARGNGRNGILIDESAGNVIGEAPMIVASSDPLPAAIPSDRNVIAANGEHGILLRGLSAANNQLYGNYVGIDATGRGEMGNGGDGIAVEAAPLTIIGAIDDEGRLRNVVAGNGRNGISARDVAITIAGNFIGVDMNSTTVIGNGQHGIMLFNITGSSFEGNLVAGNANQAIYLEKGSANQLRANYLGTDLWRIGNLSNQGGGIMLVATEETAVISNVIAYSGGDGVAVVGQDAIMAERNTILSNAIYANSGLAIDLGNDGVTVNDVGDTDLGPNFLQNYPTGLAYTVDGAGTTITGILSSTADLVYHIQIYVNVSCPLSGCQGYILLAEGDVTTDATGLAQINIPVDLLLPEGLLLSATATDPLGNTSEFPGEPGANGQSSTVIFLPVVANQ